LPKKQKKTLQRSATVPTWAADWIQYPRNKNPLLVYLAAQSAKSRSSILSALNAAALLLTSDGPGLIVPGKTPQPVDVVHVPWYRLRYEHLIGLRNLWRETFANATVNFRLSVLKGVAKQCFLLDLPEPIKMSADAWTRIAMVKGLPRDKQKHGRQLTFPELDALIKSCGSDLRGKRDRALFVAMYGAGLRRAEVVGLDLDHYNPETGTLVITEAKGGAVQEAQIGARSKIFLSSWVQVRAPSTADVRPFFLPIDKSGRIVYRRLAPGSINSIVQRRAYKAGIGRLSPHDFRRTAISNLLDAGADLAAAQAFARHAGPSTTERYDLRGRRVLQHTAELLWFPEMGDDG
jgi:integrase